MMKNFRNALCIVLAILMCLSLIGCARAGSGELNETGETTEATGTTEETTEATEESEATEVTEETKETTEATEETEETTEETQEATKETQKTTEATTPPATNPTHTHTYTDAVVKPTCTEQGYTSHTCSCGDSKRDTYVDATGHAYGEWTVTTPATTTAEGVQTRTCGTCGAAETQAIAKLPAETLDVGALSAHGMSYAASLGFTPSYESLPGYFPASTGTFTTMASARSDIENKVYGLYMSLMNAEGTVEGCRVNIVVTDNGDGTFTVLAYYG